MSIELKGKQFQALRNALVSAFPDYESLKMMVRFELDEKLQAIVALGPMNTVASNLIEWAETNGKLEELIAGARAQVPGNPNLKQFAFEVSLTSDRPPEGRLEAMVLKNVPFQQVNQFRSRMVKREHTVCRIEMPEGVGVGTGFLIGPCSVLTNWHVAKVMNQDGRKPNEVGVRFDYAVAGDGVTVPAGKFYHFAGNWLIDHSPEKELDFAVIRIASEAGNDRIGNDSETRGWLTYNEQKITVGDVQLILQHPLAAPLNLSAGSVTAINLLHKRVTYTANTERGSSGSPVFSIGWELVALHHYGEQTGNMGIPISYIWQQLSDRNKADELQRCENG